jgi:hypothetical protein
VIVLTTYAGDVLAHRALQAVARAYAVAPPGFEISAHGAHELFSGFDNLLSSLPARCNSSE